MLTLPDVTILGAGVIGLSLALELHRRGAKVTILEPGAAASQASWAAAGMLAVHDPFNPPSLHALSCLSAALYPAFLAGLEEISGQAVPFQTNVAVQWLEGGGQVRLHEQSIDPRQLALALVAAVQREGITLRQKQPSAVLSAGAPRTGTVVHAMGAWAATAEISPRKGQMLRVQLPAHAELLEVYRSEHVYVVPRTKGPQAGTALIGATLEDAGFNTDVVPEDLAGLRARGAALVPQLPELADGKLTPFVEAWAGLRPATPDGLPLLGELGGGDAGDGPRHIMAAGHFRNGILLAPATAVLIADLVEGRAPSADLAPFSPTRFAHPFVELASQGTGVGQT